MIDSIYVEQAVVDHPRTRTILQRYPKSRVIECNSYSEVFNRRQQNFRVQKARPALILAQKSAPRLHPVPAGQHLGADHNYYFSHLLNCPFDCRYCFLQGMFSSANYVLFVNYEAFLEDIHALSGNSDGLVLIFSGYDCDSLALEPLTGFAEFFVSAFSRIDNAVLELRTKRSLQ
jgi:spore photoproduct lyase